ncbi:SCO2400 family protein [Streptomyces sp. NPDC001494]
MDYCSSCRRHLNGALVCPGCGAYAPDIAPPAAVSAPRTTPAVSMAGAETHPFDAFGTGDWYDDGPVDADEEPAPAAADGAPRFQPSGEVAVRPAASQGRAARRRQLVRWKKNKRRAAVATAFAIVGGGLTLASLDRQSGDRAQAASAADAHSMGVAERQTSAESRPDATPPTGRHRATPPAHTPAAPAHAGARHSASDGQGRHAMAAGAPTTASDSRPDAVASPLPAVTRAVTQTVGSVSGSGSGSGSGAESGSGSGSASGSTGSTAQAPATSTPVNGGSTASGTTQTSPSPAATSPSQHQLCLLVVCLG